MNYVSPDLGSGVGVHLVEKNRVHFGPFQTFPYALTWSVGGFLSPTHQAGFPICGQM